MLEQKISLQENKLTEHNKIYASPEALQEMKRSFPLEVEKSFENKLKRLRRFKKITTKAENLLLKAMRLTIIDLEDKETEHDILIDRVRVSKEGRVFCETIIDIDELKSDSELHEGKGIIFLSTIEIVGSDEKIAASAVAEDDEFEIKFDLATSEILVLSLNFVTKYSDAIQRKSPNDRRDITTYLVLDDIGDDIGKNSAPLDKVIFYTGKKFYGESYIYKIGDHIVFQNEKDSLNDKFESVRIASNCKLTVFRHSPESYTGINPSKVLLEDTADIDIGGLSQFIVEKR